MSEHEDQFIYHSTEDQIRTFLNSSVWQDIEGTLTSQLSQSLVLLSGEENVDEMRRLQGKIQALRSLLILSYASVTAS